VKIQPNNINKAEVEKRSNKQDANYNANRMDKDRKK